MNHIEGTFQGKRGLSLYYQSWLPEAQAKAVIIIAHGIAEHSGRYDNTATFLASKKYAVYSFDYRGHGRSDGQRGWVEHFSFFLDDFQTFHSWVRERHPDQKVILLGHSMGAAIILAYASNNDKDLAGLILSAIPVKFRPYVPMWLVAMLQPLSVLAPKARLYRLNSSTLSRDKMVKESYDNDPLVFRGKLTARLAIDLLWNLHHLLNAVSKIQSPVLILHGTKDNLSSPDGSRIVGERIGSKDKTVKYYPGLYHEILNEPERGQVLMDIECWLERII